MQIAEGSKAQTKKVFKNFLINILNILSYFGLIKRSYARIHAKKRV